MERLEQHTCFGGTQEVWRHESSSLRSTAKFAIFLPPQAKDKLCPVLYWLSGLTCTEQNFITKAGAQRMAAQKGIILVVPDTSPRGDAVPDDPAYDLGQGAGFYVNATQEPWAQHFSMYDYVQQELPALISTHFPVNEIKGISGHSMGGHGALILALKNPGAYKSVSAFSPIVAPSEVPWGQKAFKAYLGSAPQNWLLWDSCALIAQAKERLPLLVDVGAADDFLQTQLQVNRLQDACRAYSHPLELNIHPGHDHSYYFISSIIDRHLEFHSKAFNM